MPFSCIWPISHQIPIALAVQAETSQAETRKITAIRRTFERGLLPHFELWEVCDFFSSPDGSLCKSSTLLPLNINETNENFDLHLRNHLPWLDRAKILTLSTLKGGVVMNQENIDVKEKIASFFRNTFERRDARIIAVIVILALIAGIVIATTRGGDSNEASVSDGLNGLSPVTDYVFQPNDSLGPDPFGPSFATYTVEVPTEELSTGTVSSDSTGLYGGTGEN